MKLANDQFFRLMMEKISIMEEERFSKADFLKEICDYFEISLSFIYESDCFGVFNLKDHHSLYSFNPLAKAIDFKTTLGQKLLSELYSKHILIIIKEEGANLTPLEDALINIFKVSTLILIPILNQHHEFAGIVGFADRRSKVRNDTIDIKASCATLSLLANHVKLMMFKKGIDNTETILNNILNHIGIDIYVNDFYNHDIMYANESMAKPYGGINNMMGKKCYEALFKEKTEPCDFCPQSKLLDENSKPTKSYTWDYERKLDGSWFRVISSSMPWTDGRIAHLVASVDITESKRNQILIEQLALYDHLTGLPNRRSLQDDLEKFINNPTIFSDRWFLLFCDLDGFKNINDSYGHNVGDELLKMISENLKKLPQDRIRAYRHGGDEFVVLARDEGDSKKFETLIEELFILFCKVYSYEGIDLLCGSSIGVSHFPNSAKTAQDIIFMADSAMYAAKKSGKGVVRFYQDDKIVKFEEYFKDSE